MTEERTTSRPTLHSDVWQDIQARLDRIEDKGERIETKLDSRLSNLDTKDDAIATRQTRLEGQLAGSIAMIRWLGPTGVAALVFALLKGSGFV